MSADHFSKLGFYEGRGLVWVSQSNLFPLTVAELLAIEEARRFKADAVYLRKSDASGLYIPQVYIYETAFSDDELLEVHKNLWSSGIVPLFYVVTPTEVKIFNCSKSLEEKGKRKSDLKVSPIKTFSFVGDIQKELEREKFSARLFENGAFWDEHPEILKVAESPYEKLLSGLLNAKRHLEQKSLPLSKSTISKLLVLGILVKYLEEKEDDHGTKLLEISRDFYEKFPGCEQFTDILRQRGQIIPFLKELDVRFNGRVFDLKSDEERELANADLTYVAHIFDADIEGYQFVLWKNYSFNFLPIELISGIYEAFLKNDKEKGVVYTPPYLVNLLIDECMPLDKAEEMFAGGSFKVLDPSCGSGIFLVAALKRMVQWQAILHYKNKGKLEYPDAATVKQILKNNIFGVDIEEGATLISIFSLCIAVCDKLSPMQILKDLRFDDLSQQNIRTANFFGVFSALKKEAFDLVIGNPPYNPPSGFSNKSYRKFLEKEFGVNPGIPLNDDNLALFFWDKAAGLRIPGGKICFFLPSGAFLYNANSRNYRTAFLEQYQIEKIFDFTLLSEVLFHGSANIATCAVVATDFREDKHLRDILHLVVRRTEVSEERFFFEIDHYDFHKVKYKTALENPFIWKCNLWGGGRLVRWITYLSSLRSLGAFLQEKKENEGWEYGEGYIIGHDGKSALNNVISHGRKRKYHNNVDWITGKETVLTPTFDDTGEFDADIEYEKWFEWPRTETKKIFSAPHILIKQTLGKNNIPIAYVNRYLCFKDRITGIHAPEKDNKALKQLYTVLTSNQATNRTFALATSGESGVTLSTSVLRQSDILSLPYPENPEDMQPGPAERIIQDDVLNFYITAGEKSKKSPLNSPATGHQLNAYGKVFCDTLNPIYAQNGMEWFARGFYPADSAVVFVFCFGEPRQKVLSDIFEGGIEGIERLLYNNAQRNVRIGRVVREYLHLDGYDVLILIKPRAMRYWLKSIALRDADETFSDLKINGF